MKLLLTEVLPTITRDCDRFERLADDRKMIEGAGASTAMPAPGPHIALAALHEGRTFAAGPRPLRPGTAGGG